MAKRLVACGGHSIRGQLVGLTILSITRSQSQKSACKDLKRNGQEGWSLAENMLLRAISGSCRTFYNALAVAAICT
ncbi:hypothetical protein EFO70_09985 [Lacticaseibacillus rhamnosus]|nr:hypothetical protein [Lacticaseibacillus rhamnosus]MCT3181800.1 hypothetical protein [Lacticaseibacillus rhamnosus]